MFRAIVHRFRYSMETMVILLTHQELSLLVFALEGPEPANGPASPPSCEEACPVASHIEDLFLPESISPEKQLLRHLNNHLREAFLECGMLELMSAGGQALPGNLSPEHREKLSQVNSRLGRWSCEIEVGSSERRLLIEAFARLPRGAWLSMPRTLWRLRKKLKASD